ncbi:MAG: type I glutamate--ammonia ligase [Alphaproteobacteria bacterium]
MTSEALKFKKPVDLIKFIRDQGVQFIDLNFTDIRGKWHHTAQHHTAFDEKIIENGLFFDGSSIAGWKDIHQSDMKIVPDISKVCADPFSAQKTIKIFCDVYDPNTNKPYERDPRYIAKSAEAYLKSSGIADTAYFGPEAEFFVFDNVKYAVEMKRIGFEIDSEEGPYNSAKDYPGGNSGHRPRVKGGYFPDAPVDSLSDIRGEMVTVMQSMGLAPEKHHHEVAPAQCEIGIQFSTLTDAADNIQIYKHVVHNVANAYGKSATFLPKPLVGDNGSGMHVHQSLWRGGKAAFSGDKYAGLSEAALFYIGGIIKHAKALNAFTNPTTNSYKRLVPGYEAPVLLAYSQNNRSASCRIPAVSSPNAKRVEVRFPDPLANPYLAFASMMMAGLDGIQNKIYPGEAMDKDLYHLPSEELRKIPTVCGSLREALDSLRQDNEFLLRGGVFTMDFIEAYIRLRMEEVELYETTVHPIEYQMYYSG